MSLFTAGFGGNVENGSTCCDQAESSGPMRWSSARTAGKQWQAAAPLAGLEGVLSHLHWEGGNL